MNDRQIQRLSGETTDQSVGQTCLDLNTYIPQNQSSNLEIVTDIELNFIYNLWLRDLIIN